MQVFNTSGSLVWDSLTVEGGVTIPIGSYGNTANAVLTFPDFAGTTPKVTVTRLTIADVNNTNVGISVDTTLGYPRVTISNSGYIRSNVLLRVR